ncbi:MAG: ComF family protein [Verrucomicrobiae bacterium]|nr:ComF family protein [Verrucomicrobiae bacterium]
MSGLSQRPSPIAAVRSLGAAALNIFYPPRCPGCRRPDTEEVPDSARLCSPCADELEAVCAPFCERCGETFAGNMGTPPRSFECSNCLGRKLAFDFAIASYEATKLTRELVHRFKYQGEFHLRRVLGAMLLPALSDPRIAAQGEWVMIPVPLHRRRRQEREFNQAAEISRFASKWAGFPVADILKRTRYTTQQAQLDRKERLENLRDAFALRNPQRAAQNLTGKNLLLVDDVFTTGTTVNECARVLRATLTPANLAVVTVARG